MDVRLHSVEASWDVEVMLITHFGTPEEVAACLLCVLC